MEVLLFLFDIDIFGFGFTLALEVWVALSYMFALGMVVHESFLRISLSEAAFNLLYVVMFMSISEIFFELYETLGTGFLRIAIGLGSVLVSAFCILILF